jgi:mono/diheme cytochrome c family protein
MSNSSGLAIALVCLLAGCSQQPMADQPRVGPLDASAAFRDLRGSRRLVEGTVPRGFDRREISAVSVHFRTGQIDGRPAEELPEELTSDRTLEQILERGQERYQVFCSHCHDLLGKGTGMVVKRGYPEPPTYHSDRLRQAPLGHFFQVITNGKGRMPAHAGQIPPADRWAISAYIRALQLSQYAPADQLEPQDRQALSRASAQSDEVP